MAEQFENLTRSLAHGTLSRREVMRTMVGAIAGMTLASWFPGTVFAQSQYTDTCKNPGTCSHGKLLTANSITITTPIVIASNHLVPPKAYVAATPTVVAIIPAISLVSVTHRPIVLQAMSALPILAVAVPSASVFRNVTVPARYLEKGEAEQRQGCSKQRAKELEELIVILVSFVLKIFIGHYGGTIKTARFIPPSPTDMNKALSDLENLMHEDEFLPPLIKSGFDTCSI